MKFSDLKASDSDSSIIHRKLHTYLNIRRGLYCIHQSPARQSSDPSSPTTSPPHDYFTKNQKSSGSMVPKSSLAGSLSSLLLLSYMTKKSKENKPIQPQNQGDKVETTMNEPTEGVAKFKSMPQESFRFCVEQQHGTEGKIWLENKTSKKQWECEVKSIADFAPEDIAIPVETVLGYVESCLKSSTKAVVDRNFEVDLVKNPGKKDELVLEVMFRFGISGFSWTPTYKFPMKEVAVLEIDILRSQLQDQREELDELKKRFDKVQDKDGEIQQLMTRLAEAEDKLSRVRYY